MDTNELPYNYNGYTVDSSCYHVYTEFQDPPLREAYAKYAGVTADQVAIVRGADEAIEIMIRTFCIPGKDSIIDFPPTYAMYEITANLYSIDVIKVPRLDFYELDVSHLKQYRNSKLIFICSPNNPTGNMLNEEKLINILDYYKETSIVVVDEAYIEFCPELSCKHLIDKYPNLAIIRTLSKAFGLAALRCGFILANADIIDVVQRVMAPYPVPEPVAQIARQALSSSGIERMQDNVTKIIDTKLHFIEKIERLECIKKILPGLGNFILLEFQNTFIDLNLIRERGIIVRSMVYNGLPDNYRRISLGTDAQMDKLVAALVEVNAMYKIKLGLAKELQHAQQLNRDVVK